MRELSLHILDIAHNSIKIEAKSLYLDIIEDYHENLLTIKITDDGCGMDEETLNKVLDPFYTTRTTRKVGLGIPLFKIGAEQSGGSFRIESQVGKGTSIVASYELDNIDRMPLGDMSETAVTIINASPHMNFVYNHIVGEEKFTLDTSEIKKVLNGLPITNIDITIWLKEYIKDGLKEIKSRA